MLIKGNTGIHLPSFIQRRLSPSALFLGRATAIHCRKFHLSVSDLHLGCGDSTKWHGAAVVVPEMAAR